MSVGRWELRGRRFIGVSLPLAGAQATNGPTKASMKFTDPPPSSGPAKLT